VDASIKGWYSYLNNDPTPGNELIKQDNPEMLDEQSPTALKSSKSTASSYLVRPRKWASAR